MTPADLISRLKNQTNCNEFTQVYIGKEISRDADSVEYWESFDIFTSKDRNAIILIPSDKWDRNKNKLWR